MKTIKHTPGPWILVPWQDDKNRKIITIIAGSKYLASLIMQSDDSEMANGRLIAAAPDLLEAAKVVADTMFKEPLYMEHQDMIFALQKAIAKAEGK